MQKNNSSLSTTEQAVQIGTFAAAERDSFGQDNNLNSYPMQKKSEVVRTFGNQKVRIIDGYRMTEIITRVTKGEVLVAKIDKLNFKYATFSVILSRYNYEWLLPNKGIYVHCSHKAGNDFIVLVPVTEEEFIIEKNNPYAKEWKKRIPKEYY